MKPSHWLSLATAITGAAIASSIYVATRSQPTTAGNQPANSPGVPSSEHASTSRSARLTPTSPSHQASRQTTTRSSQGFQNTPLAEPLQIHGTPPRTPGAVPEAQWFANAERVALEANRELRRMTAMLDLSPTQQEQIFGALARRSGYWLPGMQTPTEARTGNVGTPSPSTAQESDEVLAYLDIAQQQTLIEQEMDRQAWWEEVLPQLLPPDFDLNTNSTIPPAEPDTKAFEGSDVLE